MKEYKHDKVTEVKDGIEKAVGDTPVWVLKNMKKDPVVTFPLAYERLPKKNV